MKNIDPIKVVRAAVTFFLIGVLLKTWGPFSDGKSFFHHAAETAIVMVFFLILMTFFKQFEKTPNPQPIVELDEETAHRVDALLAEGKDVAAVKAIREGTGAGLQSATATMKARRERQPQDNDPSAVSAHSERL